MDIREAYETAATTYRKKYAAIPPRTDDVDHGFSFLAKENPFVIEIGCAYGREAAYILTKTSRYIGIDIAQPFIDMACTEVPEGEFQCVNVMNFTFPERIDAVFAFASLLHSPKADVEKILERAAYALNSGGIIYLSLKRRAEYSTAIEADELVSRRFYYYTREDILGILPPELHEVSYSEQERAEPWFTQVLQKQVSE